MLGAGPDPHELIRRAEAEPGLVALVGDWFGGDALLSCAPVRTTADLAELDAVDTPADMPADFVGGGWFGVVDFAGTARFAFHDQLLRHRDGQWTFEAIRTPQRADALQLALDRWRTLLDGPDATVSWSLGPVTVPPRAGHLAAVERAVELIRAGELYQVNVCTRLSADFAGSAAGLFADVAARLRPARGALLGTADRRLACFSPELFLAVEGRHVRTSPIKGTLPRTAADDGNDQRLRASVKDAAENVMIVDLLRNDLGRVSEPGSVRVDALLGVHPHPGVWHLVSTVSATTTADVTTGSLLAATFPPGSVTGAPKLRALAAIAELETPSRGAYTGAAGAVVAGGRAEFAVTIRSFEVGDGRLELGVGGGITADSVPMAEWHECRHKAAPLLRAAGASLPPEPVPSPPVDTALLETVLAVDGVPVRSADHLARLDRSARELTGRGVPPDLADQVRAAAATVPIGRAVVRVVLRDGSADVSAAPLGPPPTGTDVVTVVRPDGLWRHKWAERRWTQFALPSGSGQALPSESGQSKSSAEALFLAADGTVLETTRGNVFLVCDDGTLVTAPLRDDLLPGVTRRAVLDLARDTGRTTELGEFTVADLHRHAAFWTSSLSGAVPITAVDGVPVPRADDVVAGFAQALLNGVRLGR